MKRFIFLISSMLLMLFQSASADPGQLYGRIYTTDKEMLEGFIRWDKNEASWDDILDGYKELDRNRSKKYRVDDDEERTHRVRILGITVYEENNNFEWTWNGEAQSGIRIGHIQTIIPDGKDNAILILKSGEKVELKNSSTDLGEGIRELLIDDIKEGITELYWEDIDKVEFLPTPKGESKFGTRLFGTVTSRRGESYTGFVCWDMDEMYDTDILDGRDRSHNRKIEFGKIKSIESLSSSSSLVTLKDGRELRLDESNDIDSGNRGIVISDPLFGRVIIPWDEFDFIQFQDPPQGLPYDKFDGGERLHGTVYTEEDEKYVGNIKWDDDEEFTWEMLDGNIDDVEFDIEFGAIRAIEKISSRTSRVELKDGRILKLKGSNDINSENKGIFIQTDKGKVEIDWSEFAKVEFTN